VKIRKSVNFYHYFIFIFLLSLGIFGCGSDTSLDHQGLSNSKTALNQFTRASQLYFRGRLTASLEEFNGVIYRFPDSPIASDARLAIRRIESDLSGEEVITGNYQISTISSRIAVVGKPSVTSTMQQISSSIRTLASSVSDLTDAEAPELTVVFYHPSHEESAHIIADSLSAWLSHPSTISCRPGDELINTVAEGYDILVLVGTDAVFVGSN